MIEQPPYEDFSDAIYHFKGAFGSPDDVHNLLFKVNATEYMGHAPGTVQVAAVTVLKKSSLFVGSLVMLFRAAGWDNRPLVWSGNVSKVKDHETLDFNSVYVGDPQGEAPAATPVVAGGTT